jgi:hypothetical protein
MASAERLYDALTLDDLEQLKELALKEHKEFFKRNPNLKSAYYNSLIGICLCQGAASHYLNPDVGIKDFDIWHFYVENKEINFPYRAHKRIDRGYKSKSIDFLKRAISNIHSSYSEDSGQIIMEYLLERNTTTKELLLKKAIIGLFPNEIFGRVLWKGIRL